MSVFRAIALCIVCAAYPAWASAGPPVPADARPSDIVFLGEVHDNPAHHANQAAWVSELAPKALVFEMITPQLASTLTPDLLGDEQALEAALGWNQSGWPDFAMYYPIFTASDAQIYGAAVPGQTARAVMKTGSGAAMTPQDVAAFGLNEALPQDQQAKREAMQMAAHCDALPAELLSGMVNVQRVRDAVLARQALRALEQTGGPVVVVTGNGHARLDWGAPAAVARVAPQVTVYALAQSEAGQSPAGGFDGILDTAAAERPDPCAAFK